MNKLVLYPHGDPAKLDEIHRFFVETEPYKEAGTPNIYKTYVHRGKEPPVAFITTAKDVHLQLGLLSASGQYWLTQLLEKTFTIGPNQPILLLGRAGEDRGLLVTQTLFQDVVTFHLSPAR